MSSSLPSSAEITVDQLYQHLSNGNFCFLLDVRTQSENDYVRIANTDLLVEYDLLPEHRDLMPRDKQTVIYCYCRSGRRSGIAVEYLRSIGYTRAFNVIGGIMAWVEAGFEVVGRFGEGPLEL